MEEYDVVVVGGGIAGSIAARFSARYGFKTLFIEKRKTPRHKQCSGIQFTYFEKLVGENIPRNRLCKNELHKVEMIAPSGKVFRGVMKILNFWRSTFDSWLNELAVDAGAEFRDQTSFIDFRENGKSIKLKIQNKESRVGAKTKYLIGADGLTSLIRRKMRPQDFEKKASGATMDYFFEGDADLDPNTLYMIHRREFSPLMFAWAFMKDDLWVIGTGANKNPIKYAERFYNYVKKRYRLQGEVVKKIGFSSTLKSGVYLGKKNLLMVGDAAGLVDLYRGLGMDNAALSGRLAARAIIGAEETERPAIEIYENLMKKIVRRLKTNEKKQAKRYSSNESLERSFATPILLKGGIQMLIANQINRLLPPEGVIMLPF